MNKPGVFEILRVYYCSQALRCTAMSDSILDYLAKVMSRKWENFKYLKPECVLTNTSVEDPI